MNRKIQIVIDSQSLVKALEVNKINSKACERLWECAKTVSGTQKKSIFRVKEHRDNKWNETADHLAKVGGNLSMAERMHHLRSIKKISHDKEDYMNYLKMTGMQPRRLVGLFIRHLAGR